MVTKETCQVCKGNKFVEVVSSLGSKRWRPCHACNGSGYTVRLTVKETSGR